MAFSPGDIYTVAKVPMTLYKSSDLAAIRAASSSKVTVAGDYRIDPDAEVYWTNANGDWLKPDKKPASGAIALYAIQERPWGTWYTIGWVREDDNLQGITIHNIPSQISTNDSSYKVSLRGTQGIDYTYTAKIGTKEIHKTSTDLTYSSTAKTFDLTSTIKNNIYTALGSKSTGTMNITVETKYNNKTIHTSKANITVVIPSGGNPTWTKNPKVEIVGAIDGKAYRNISKIKVTNGTLSYKNGASFKSLSIIASGYTSSASPFTTPVISSTGNIGVKVVVTDTRNRTVSYSTTVNFLDAKGLSVTQFTASRLTNNTVKVDGKGNFTTAIEGTPKYKIESRVRGTTTWKEITSATNVTVSGTDFSLTKTYATTLFNSKTSYDIRLTVIGSSTSVSVQTVVGTESVPFSFGKHGAGAGVMFDNKLTHNFQVGAGGIISQGDVYVKNKKLATSEEVPTMTTESYYTLTDYPDGRRVMHLRNRISLSNVPTTRWGAWTFKYPHKFKTVEGITFNLMLPQIYRPSFDLSTQLFNVTNEGYSFEIVSMAGVTTPLTKILIQGHYVSLVVWGTI